MEQPITAVGDKKLSTYFHTPLKTERLQKPGPKPYRQQTTVKAKITEWPITTRSSEEVAVSGGGGALFYGVSQSIATHALFIKMENEIGPQVRSIRKASSFYVSLVYCRPADFEICLLYDQIYVRRSLVVSRTST